eukprot:scaffold249274_cov31-Tisochrysis_lutea.AAC.1
MAGTPCATTVQDRSKLEEAVPSGFWKLSFAIRQAADCGKMFIDKANGTYPRCAVSSERRQAVYSSKTSGHVMGTRSAPWKGRCRRAFARRQRSSGARSEAAAERGARALARPPVAPCPWLPDPEGGGGGGGPGSHSNSPQ